MCLAALKSESCSKATQILSLPGMKARHQDQEEGAQKLNICPLGAAPTSPWFPGPGAPGSSCSPHLALDGLSVSSRLRGWDSHSGSAFVQDAVIFRTVSLSEAPQPHSRFFHNYSFNPSLGIGSSQRQDSVVKQGRLDQTWLHGES